MSKIAALKKKAADTEKKSPEKAIPIYVELLAEMEKSPDELDVALFNRVGDLMVKAGNVAQAVDYYEKAVDHYVDGGFFNNASRSATRFSAAHRVAPPSTTSSERSAPTRASRPTR